MPYYMRDRLLEKNFLPFLMETVHQGISIIDHKFNIVFINRAALKMLDLPIGLFKTDPSLEHLFRFNAERGDYGPGDIDELVASHMEAAKRLISQDVERKRPDGKIIRIQGTSIGRHGFITLYTDVTEERTYEAKLEKIQIELAEQLDERSKELSFNRDLLINAINAIEDGLVVFDSEERLVLANSCMQTLYPSLKRHLLTGAHISQIEGFTLPSTTTSTGADEQDANHHITEQKLHDDKWYRIEQSGTADGGRIAVFSNISSYKEQTHKLQEHTSQLVKLLQKEITLSETQREFVSMASHEFKTPLAIIDSNAQRIQRKISNITEEKLGERVAHIRESVERMQYLINRFMDFSADEISGFQTDSRKQNFRATLERLCKTHSEMSADINIEWDLSALPEFAKFDQTLLDQCVSNIISNAIKYSKPGTPISIHGDKNERYLMIEVRDQGVGIPKEELSKIFNKYYRASTSSGIAGTGIGLNFAQMALKEHGGHIEVTSVVDEGSCFTIFLPRNIEVVEQENGSLKEREQSCADETEAFAEHNRVAS